MRGLGVCWSWVCMITCRYGDGIGLDLGGGISSYDRL